MSRGWPRLQAGPSVMWRAQGGAHQSWGGGRGRCVLMESACDVAGRDAAVEEAIYIYMEGCDATVEEALEQLHAHGARLAHLAEAHLGAVRLHVHLALRRHHLVVLA